MDEVIVGIAESERAIKKIGAALIGVWADPSTASVAMRDNWPELVRDEDYTFYVERIN